MTVNRFRRWRGYAAVISGSKLILACLIMLASTWVGEDVAIAISWPWAACL